MKRLYLAILVLALACSTGCAAGYAQTPAPKLGDAGEPADTALADSINDFGFEVLQRAAVPDQNTAVSPISLHSLLTSIRVGARKTTADEMDRVLRQEDTDIDFQSYSDLIARLRKVDLATVNVANAIWFDEGFTPSEPFVEINANFFGAQIQTGDLGSVKTASAIDSWVSKHTGGKIKNAALEPDSQMSVELVNTLYFLGEWADEFDERDTYPQEFRPEIRQPIEVDMMHAGGNYLYSEDATAQMVMLPYKGGDVVTYVLVPTGDTQVGDVLAGLNAAEWNRRISSLEEQEGDVAIPRLEFSAGVEGLESVLASMGMPTAFSSSADLSGIGVDPRGPLRLSRIVHRAYLRVDEKGAEAAAISGADGTLAAEVSPARFSLTADRPYLFVIAEKASGCLLFTGVIGDPPQ
jgi:serpin B